MPDSLIGAVVDGRYAILSRLGSGGMATVYRARDKRLERDVALKLMHPHLGQQPDFTERFNREARAAASLSSPYVVAVHDQGIWNTAGASTAYLVMEYIDGPDLRRELSRLGSFTLGTALSLTQQVLRALSAAHAKGIAHRDVKPENVMLTAPLARTSIFERPDFHAKVADFGLARAASSHATTTGQLMGTVAYIAPEVITEGASSARSDLYAVGIMLYEFLTGSLPFKADTPIATAYQHINASMPRVGDQAEWIPEAVDSFIGLLTAKDPASRPANGKEALDELLAVMEAIPEEDLIRRIPVIPRHKPAEAEEKTSVDVVTTRPDPTKEVASQPTMISIPTPSAPLAAGGVASEAPAGGVTAAGAGAAGPAAPSFPPESRRSAQAASHELDSASFAGTSHDAEGSPTLAPTVVGDDGVETPRKRRKGLLFLLLGILVIATSGVAWYFMAGPGQRVEVPKVNGLSYEKAESSLKAEGFASKRQEAYSDTVEAGLVIRTDPPGGSSVHPDTKISIVVSLGIEQVSVPDLAGKTREEASALAKAAPLAPTFTESYSEDVPKGSVISQSLEAGASVNHDSAIEIVISKGREPITVPVVTGQNMKIEDATAAIEKAGLKVEATGEFSDTVPEGQVMSQDPQSGTLFRGDAVKLVYSKGPELVEVPDVIGKQQGQAEKILKDAGFQVEVSKLLGGYFGTVRLQDPSGGEKVKKGSTVTITVV